MNNQPEYPKRVKTDAGEYVIPPGPNHHYGFTPYEWRALSPEQQEIFRNGAAEVTRLAMESEQVYGTLEGLAKLLTAIVDS